MTSAAVSPRRYLLAAGLGIWAAAVALAANPAIKAVLALPAAAIPLVWWMLAGEQRWVYAFLGAAILLPPFPIALGDSGPHICLALAALGLFAGLLRRNWRIDVKGPAGPLMALFAILLASGGFAAIYSGAQIAAGSVVRTFLFGISIYIYFYARDAAPPIRAIYCAAIASALFACIDFYFQFPAPAGYGPQFVWLDSGMFRRAQGVFYEASTLGNFCAFFLVMIAVALSMPRAQSPVSRKLLLIGAPVLLAALVLSYSRASLVCVAAALCVLGWRNRGRVQLGRLALLLAAGGAIGLLLLWEIFPAFAETYWLRLSASAEFLFSATNGVLSGRLENWRVLGSWIAEHPWRTIFGIGYKTLPYTDYLGEPIVADNMYVSLLIETGIAGLVALVWLNVSILRSAARAAAGADPRRAFFGLWMLCFWAGESVQMMSGDILTYWRVLPLYLWALAMAIKE